MHAFITVGISASGKSSWAAEQCANDLSIVEVNRDKVRAQMQGLPEVDWTTWKFNHNQEKLITEIIDNQIRAAAQQGRDVICSDTNLIIERVAQRKKFLQELGYTVKIVVFDVLVEEAIRRDRARASSVGEQVIERQHMSYLTLVTNPAFHSL